MKAAGGELVGHFAADTAVGAGDEDGFGGGFIADSSQGCARIQRAEKYFLFFYFRRRKQVANIFLAL